MRQETTALLQGEQAEAPKSSIAKMHRAALRTGFAVGAWIAPRYTVEQAMQRLVNPTKRDHSSQRARMTKPTTGEVRRHRLLVRGQMVATHVWGSPKRQPYALLIHGWESASACFHSWVEDLQAAGLAIVAFDLPGHGLSGGDRCSWQLHVDALLTVGRCFGDAEVAVAHGIGATVLAMSKSPLWRARKCALISPVGDIQAAAQRHLRSLKITPRLDNRFLDRLDEIAGTRLHQLKVHTQRFPNTETLIVHDLSDRRVPWHEGERYARYWPGARLQTTEGLSYDTMLDAPEVISSVLEFISGSSVGQRVVSTNDLPYGVA